jgi:hypothetical protein
MDLIHLAIKVSKPKATLAYRLFVAAPTMMTNQSNLCYDKEYTRYEVTRYGVVRCAFITERQPRSVHYNDVSARDRLTTMIRSIPTKIIS